MISINKLFFLNLASYFHLNITKSGYCTKELFHLLLEQKNDDLSILNLKLYNKLGTNNRGTSVA
jgi:hypothetical protein